MTYPCPLFNVLKRYTKKPKIQFHMPGHCAGQFGDKKFLTFLQKNLFKIDLTEIDDLDCLHAPENVIKQTQEKIANIYDSKSSYMLVNGSTVGLQALIFSVASEGDKIIVARNCHRSVMSAITLSGAIPVFVMPFWNKQWDIFASVDPSQIELAIKNNPDAKAIIITSPTYEGIVSEIDDIADICHQNEIPLIVDESHGGHFAFSERFPLPALKQKADAVVHSLHKTCGSLTQTSLLHISKNTLINQKHLEENLKMLQTTSPSYILMSSLDATTSYMASEKGTNQIDQWYRLSNRAKHNLSKIDRLEIFNLNGDFEVDPSKLLLKMKHMSGQTLADFLENNYNIGIESLNNVSNLLFMNVGNKKRDFKTLYNALKNIAALKITEEVKNISCPDISRLGLPPKVAFYRNSVTIPLSKAEGKLSQYIVAKCPPGYCILIPGETISQKHLHYLENDMMISVVNDKPENKTKS